MKKEEARERDGLAGEIKQLAEAQKSMTLLIEERQKRQGEVEQALGAERLKVITLGRQAESLKDLIAKLEQRLDGTARGRSGARPADEARASGDLPPDLPPCAIRDGWSRQSRSLRQKVSCLCRPTVLECTSSAPPTVWGALKRGCRSRHGREPR